ncbi:hypothetical protein [Paraflavitalea speifideaquila]|uniref:hypothetical protein n=1 Tax=Paraflavitalea speifideaquila TaxID=3076558 RepID=UPI0028E9321F|nr:hypothetical protein [Paraflavitalea speifideiaquila]
MKIIQALKGIFLNQVLSSLDKAALPNSIPMPTLSTTCLPLKKKQSDSSKDMVWILKPSFTDPILAFL